MKKPLPHQIEAIDATLLHFAKNDRGHIVMACGTGKTITALWIAEKLKPKAIVIFLPSLALINQFMKEWLKETSFKNYTTLTVCSDASVTSGAEDESLLFEEIDFPVTTSSLDVREYLMDGDKAIKIIFCTYQSSWLLGEACHNTVTIDLGIFDEAHKTAGYGKELFSYPLHDKNLKIKKRLFVTATPRHSSIVRKDKEGNFLPLYSMDDESLYGKRIYTLDFRRAINLDLICDYKVIISVADLNKHAFNADFDLQEKALSLLDAINTTSSNKVITYHKSIRDAKNFADYINSSGLIKTHKAFHVNGQDKMQDRVAIMGAFRGAKRAIICNARCLTEGVDIPAVDMVAFLNPKSSKIDIVQAIGRALRKYPGKVQGNIFLPVFIDKNIGDESEAIEQSDFHHIWEVLNALSEQDSELNDIIKQIKSSGENNYASNVLDDFVNFNVSATKLSELKHLISIKILNKLANKWDHGVFYDLLVEHKKTDPDFKNLRKNRRLYRYFNHMRHAYRGGWNLEIGERLHKLGLPIKSEVKDLDATWEAFYRELIEYKTTGLDFNNIPQRDGALGKWCARQRAYYKDGSLKSDRVEKLLKIGFVFDYLEEVWRKSYAEYKNKMSYDLPLGAELSSWGSYQRKVYAKGAMPKHRLALLKAAGFNFKENIVKFAKKHPLEGEMFMRFKALVKEQGHAIIKSHGKTRYLYKWANRLRDKHNAGKLLPAIKKELDKYGFIWKTELNPKTGNLKTSTLLAWEHQALEVARYIKNGLPIPGSYDEFCKKLIYRKAKGSFTSLQTEYLNKINFPWDKFKRVMKYGAKQEEVNDERRA